MSRSIDDFDYLRLSAGDRLLLAQDIIDSVVAETAAEPLTAEQLAELDRRCRDLDSGKVTCIAWNDVRDRFLGGK